MLKGAPGATPSENSKISHLNSISGGNTSYASATNSGIYNFKDTDNFTAALSNNDFLYVHLQFPNINVPALLYSGSSNNLMSKQLYEYLRSNVK